MRKRSSKSLVPVKPYALSLIPADPEPHAIYAYVEKGAGLFDVGVELSTVGSGGGKVQWRASDTNLTPRIEVLSLKGIVISVSNVDPNAKSFVLSKVLDVQVGDSRNYRLVGIAAVPGRSLPSSRPAIIVYVLGVMVPPGR
jgi:hypothetical protein